MRTGRVEISQQGSIPRFKVLAFLLQLVALRFDVIDDDQLNCALGSSVWVCGANWADLGDGDHVGNAGGIAVDGCGGGEHDVGDIVGGHAAKEGDGAANVDTVVFEGDLCRFSYGLERS